MHGDEPGAATPQGGGRRRRGLVGAFVAVVLVGAAAVGVVHLAGATAPESLPTAGDGTSGTRSPGHGSEGGAAEAGGAGDGSDDGGAPAAPVPLDPMTVELATTTVSDVLGSVAGLVDASGTADLDGIPVEATGLMRAELEAQLLELESNAWVVTGSPVVETLEIVDGDPSGSAGPLTVRACVDSSAVVLARADGGALPASTTPRAWNLFTLTPTEDGWRLSDHGYPADPSC